MSIIYWRNSKLNFNTSRYLLDPENSLGDNIEELIGEKAKIDGEQIKKLKEEGMGATAIARQLKIDRTSVYRLLKRV